MHKITILLGSSLLKKDNELSELTKFINECNNEFIKIYNISLVKELLSNTNNNNDIIKNSDLCFFLFFDEVISNDYKEIENIFNIFKNSTNNKPKIYIYIKYAKYLSDINDSIKNLMNVIDTEYKHFYSSFTNIDTIKLKLLLNVKLLENNFIELNIKDDYIKLNDANLVSLNNVEEFSKNIELTKFKEEFERINNIYLSLLPKINNKNKELMDEFFLISSKRVRLLNEIDNLKKDIFELSLGITKDILNGNITDLMKEALRLLDKGNFKAALDVLNSRDIDYELNKILNDQIKHSTIYIREHMFAINILKTLYSYSNRFNEIEERFEKIRNVSLQFDLELDSLFEEAKYYYLEHNYNKSKDLFNNLINVYNKNNYNKILISRSHNYLGNIYRRTYDYDNAYKEYKIALGYFNHESNMNYTELKTYAQLYNNLALVDVKLNNYKEAEDYNIRALKIREKLVLIDSDSYYDLAMSYNNLGYLYRVLKDYDKSIMMYHKSLDIKLDKLDLKKEEYLSSLGINYNNLGFVYKHKEDYIKSLEYYKKALEISDKLYLYNPMQAIDSYALRLKNLGSLYIDLKEYKLAEEMLLKSIDIRRSLIEDRKYVEIDLLKSYLYLLDLYKITDRLNDYNKVINDIKPLMSLYSNEDIVNTIKMKHNIVF